MFGSGVSGVTLASLRAAVEQLTAHALIPVADGEDRLVRIAAMENLRAALAAAQGAEVAALVAERRVATEVEIATVERPGVGRARRRDEARRRTIADIALARRISPWQATGFVAFAEQARTDLPETFRLVATGALSERRAELVFEASRSLEPQQRRVVDATLAPDLVGWGDRKVGRKARAEVYRVDPAGVVARNAYAMEQRRVSVRPAPECMAWMTVLMSMPDAVALRAQLEREATAMVAAGDSRTRAQVMSDLVVERIAGRSVAEGPAVAVELIISDRTLLGGDDPARFADGEPYPAPLARDLALGASAAARTVRRLFNDPAGRLIAAETASRLFTEAMRSLIRWRDGTCTTPWCDAPIADIDHDLPHTRGGPTSIANGRGRCRWCNTTKGAGPPSAPVVSPPSSPDRPRRPERSHLERRVRRRVDRQRRRALRRRARAADRVRDAVLVDLAPHRQSPVSRARAGTPASPRSAR